MSLAPVDWVSRLAQAVAAAIRNFHQSHLKDSPVVVFDLGCFPWHGRVELSFLTAPDLDANPRLFDRGAIASWAHYDFTCEMETWRTDADAISGQQMADLYHDTDDDEDDLRGTVVETFLRARPQRSSPPKRPPL